MPQLDPTWFVSQLFWLVVTFVMLYQVLSRWALPRMQSVLELRKESLASDLDNAARLTKESDQVKQDYEQALIEARARAQQLFAEASAAHKAKSAASEKEMDGQITAMLSEAKRSIEAKKRELMEALVPAGKELADMIVDKLAKETAGKTRPQAGELKVRNG